MSQNDAQTSESMKVATKLMSTEKHEKEKQTTGIEFKGGSSVKKCQADGVENCSKLRRKDAEVDASGDKDDQESENIIQLLFGPKVNLNVYVIAEIAKLLDFQDLQSLRRVNKVWSEGVTTTFLRKSAVVLRSGERSEKELEAFEKDTKNLKKLKALKISLGNKFGFEQEPEMFNDIFAALSPNLKDFELEYSPYNEDIFLPRASIKLPLLSSLTLQNLSLELEEETSHQLFEFIYASAPNLTELAVEYFFSHHLSPLLIADGRRNWSLAPKLKCLKVFDDFPSEHWSTLVKFPQNWESLEIFADGKNLESLGALLEKNKDSLVSLKLSVELSAELSFPKTFSKLQKLELIFIGYMHNELNFGGRELNYTNTFPALISLSVRFGKYSDFDTIRIWTSIFPPQVFKGLQCLELELDYFPFNNYAQFLRWEGIAGDWAETMFPNARLQNDLIKFKSLNSMILKHVE